MGPIICRTYVGYGFSTVKSGDEKLEINNGGGGREGEPKQKKKKNPTAKEKREKRYGMVITQCDCPEK